MGRQCDKSKGRYPCDAAPGQCPLDDTGFIYALEVYILAGLLRCPNRKHATGSYYPISPADVSFLFPDIRIFDFLAVYLDRGYLDLNAFGSVGNGGHRQLMCKHLRDAHWKWFKSHSPPGRSWLGKVWED